MSVLCWQTSIAQNPAQGKISGLIKDGAGKPMEFVTVMLLKAQDSTLVKGAVSNAAGAYEFENIPEGRYQVSASQLGYQKGKSETIAIDASHPDVKVPVLVLREGTQVLDAVTITTKKPFIEQEIDRTVINVENSIVASGNNALEVLEKAPGVTIDRQNDQIQLKGRSGVIVMIDGKQTYLSGQEVANLLKNTPSDNIEKIEIITNPSAKYDAAGNTGIINIRMKKNKSFGTNGTLTAGAGYGRYEKANGSLLLNHREGKLNAFGNYSYMYRKSFQENELNRIIPYNGTVTYFDQASRRPNQFDGHNYRAGLDFFATQKSTFGVLVTGFINDWQQFNAGNSTNKLNENRELVQQQITEVKAKNHWWNVTSNLNYKYDFNGKGHELTVDGDYSKYNGNAFNGLATLYTDADGIPNAPDKEIRNNMPSQIDIWAFKTDYTRPTKKGKWEAGLKSSFVQTDNNLLFDDLLFDDSKAEGSWQFNDSLSNQFKYKENINAGYLNYATQLDKKTSLQIGLRVEQTHSRGHSVTIDSVVSRNYLNLFPTFFLSRQLDTNHVLNLSYSRRIDRPNYQDLNPFKFYLDPITFQVGNPYLRPQYTHSWQLTHVYKGSFSTSPATSTG